ncbi:MAG: bifunctional DedA family/phosphatase PAP2 family protein [Xanthomonadaceae bacterium]|jgi:membrane protein DedA with SNARE-associated domain|nr:bifunctional DedA family/phosphatase PAP2 family protein [Xanthomonadaceae bacterium]
MNSSWIDVTLAWIGSHPILAGAVIFAIAFCDAVVILGSLVPALPLLFAIGALIGMGQLSGPYAVMSATLGAFAGDATSFWVGHRWGKQLRRIWPFSRYPQLLDRSETLFRRNAFKSILVARYVGPIRPFVPAIAGMAGMPLRHYALISGMAAFSWATLFLLPGWLFGRAYEAVAAVAGHLLIVVTLLLGSLALTWFLVLYIYRWFAAHADSLLTRILDWSHRHPKLSRYSLAVLDPSGRESVPLAMLAIMLLAISWAWFALLIMVIGHGEPLWLDLAVHELMLMLRNPLADYPMAALAMIGNWPVLVPASAVVLGYFIWRKRWLAAAHWLAALAFGLALTTLLGATVEVVRPNGASSGFGFPSITVTMSTIVFGFFAVLISRELPGRSRVWPYMVAATIVAWVGFARLYLGAHWLSDIVGGVLFGVVWLLILGIAYRRRTDRSFWVKPLAGLFYGTFALAALWYAPRHIDAKLIKFEPPPPAVVRIDAQQWWLHDWQQMPARRKEFDNNARWPLDVQVSGPLESLRTQLETHGWKVQAQANWEAALNTFDTDASPEQVPVLPATLGVYPESLLLLHEGETPNELYALRLWSTPIRLQPGDVPLWIGTAQTLHFQRKLRLIGLWRPINDTHPALNQLVQAIDPLEHLIAPHPESGLATLRVRIAPEAPPALEESLPSDPASPTQTADIVPGNDD